MKTMFSFALLVFVCSASYAKLSIEKAMTKAIYGVDDRVYFSSPESNPFAYVAQATAALIPSSSLSFDGINFSTLKKTLIQKSRVCSDERFATDPVPSLCTGFLVGPDLLLTAGHCIRNDYDCENMNFVFDVQKDLLTETADSLLFNSNNVYSCKSIVHREYQGASNSGRLDFALVTLDRPASFRKPLDFRKSGTIENGTPVAVVGHPSGLPLIVAENAVVRSNTQEYFFTTNLDSFGGNSGSPVINKETGLVEGLLVRGEKDYIWDDLKKCNRPVVCSEENCRGEDVTRITSIPELMSQ